MIRKRISLISLIHKAAVAAFAAIRSARAQAAPKHGRLPDPAAHMP